MTIPVVLLLQAMLAGFLAVACLRASVPAVVGRLQPGDLLRFPGRVERLRRSRWQWFSMVALLLVLRLQGEVPLALEAMVAVQLAAFLAIPTRGTP